MIGRQHHLGDERLLDCYFADRVSGAIDPPAAEHLADCATCASRYAGLTRFMDGVRSEADAETAVAFPPERLRVQQQEIASRIAHIGHSAHVIHFPARVPRHMTVTSRVAPRWIAAAAAAGLVVGVGATQFFGGAVGRTSRVQVAKVEAAPAPATAQPVAAAIVSEPQPAALDDDEVFLSELESALDRPRTHELLPFDALTPGVRDLPGGMLEVSNRLR